MVDPGAIWMRAMRARRYRAAWALSQRVLRARDPAGRDDPALPYHRRWVWDGRALDGADVLVRCYHGLGDAIMFARFLPLLAARAASVTVEAPPPLAPLLATVAGVGRVLPFDPARPARWSGVDVEMGELAFALRATPEEAPAPYLATVATPSPPGTIGLCHATGAWDEDRRVPAALLAPVCALRPCVTLMPEPCALPVLNPGGCPAEIVGTAALIAGLDLVVTVDTMVAHLAGALGRPVWLLLKAEPDWRWVPHAGDSAWYPTMRTFTQPEPGAWEPVIAAVAAALRAETRKRAAA